MRERWVASGRPRADFRPRAAPGPRGVVRVVSPAAPRAASPPRNDAVARVATSTPGRRPRLVILTGLDVRAFRGGEKYAATLGRELRARGVDVLLYSKVDPHEKLRLDGAALSEAIVVPVAFYRLWWLPILPPMPRNLREFLRTLRTADMIFTLESTPRFVALVVLLSRLLDRRLAVGFHHPSQAEALAGELQKRSLAGVRARLFRWFLKSVDVVHTINANQAAVLREAGLASNVAMVHSFTTAEPQPPVPADPATFRALFVGPLEREQKGVDLLAEIGRRVLAASPDVHLSVAGTGRDERFVQELAAQFPQRVTLLGFVPEAQLPAAYAASDVLWLTSRAESFSLVALEALTQGVPVVSFAIPGLDDVTSIYPAGRVHPFDLDAFVQKVLGLRNLARTDPDAYARLREACRRAAVDRFGAAAMVPRLAGMLGLALTPDSADGAT